MLLLVFWPLAMTAQEQDTKPKRIYITLDVSGSMEGNKYVMANYAAQIISVFSRNEDITNLYYFGEPHELSGKQDYKTIQIPFGDLDHKRQITYNEISDLTSFLKNYSPNQLYEDWLFIIGDGDWSMRKGKYDSKTEFDATWKKLKPLLLKGNIQVCYLQTGETLDESTAFTDSLSTVISPTIDIRKADPSAPSVLGNCVYFANKILGFSNESVKVKQTGNQCVTFKSELPLERFILLYQSNEMGKVQVESIEYGGNCVSADGIVLKGNPSTAPLINENEEVLNGAVWEVSCQPTIPGNAETKVCFDQAIDASNLILYPYVDVMMQMRPFGYIMDTLNESSYNMFDACDTLSMLNVVITLTDRQGHKFPPPIMQKMDVKMVVEGITVNVGYETTDTTFRAVIPMTSDRVSYFVMVECPGYFSRSTINNQQTVQKTLICKPDPEIVPLITLPIQVFDPVVFKTLREGEEFGGSVVDSLFNVIASLGSFDLQTVVDNNSYPYDGGIGLEFDAGQLTFTHKPKSTWCECAFPDTLHYTVTLKSNPGILHDERVYEGFVVPVLVPVDRRSFVVRCSNCIVLLIVLFLLLLYFIALLKKNRFHKNARLKNSYVVDDNPKETQKEGKPMRKPEFGAWLNRWFNPFVDEKNTISFSRPKTPAMTFTASESPNKVLLNKGFDLNKMTIPNYVPQPKDKDKKKMDPISISKDAAVEIKKTEGGETTTLGHVKYVAEGKDDVGGYRFFVGMLIVMAMCVMGYLVFILIKGL
jgi:hypothetical protein